MKRTVWAISVELSEVLVDVDDHGMSLSARAPRKVIRRSHYDGSFTEESGRAAFEQIERVLGQDAEVRDRWRKETHGRTTSEV